MTRIPAKRVHRQRRARRSKNRIARQNVDRLTVFRSNRHIYAQVIRAEGGCVLVSASTLDKDLRAGATGNVAAASAVGQLVASRALQVGLTKVAFDRNGFKYHGRVRALADAAREAGLEF